MSNASRWLAMLAVVTFSAAAQAQCRVAIDVGHSAQSPGATSARGETEWRYNEQLAQAVHAGLQRAGIDSLILSAPAGRSLSLLERPATAAAAGASLLLSLHHDSVQPHYLQAWQWAGHEWRYSDRFRGYGLFVSARNEHFDESTLAARDLAAAFLRAGLHPSLHHAEPIAGEGRQLLDAQAGIYRFDELAVLAHASMPAVLIEAGVIAHRDEELEVATPEFRAKVGDAVVEAARSHCARTRAAKATAASSARL